MDLNETAVFVRVVQAGSFSGAARQLGLPTSTVSTRVSRLEKRLKVTLLQRTTRRLQLTEAGRIYFEHASRGLSHMLDAEVAVTEATGEPQGLLRVAAPADIGDRLLSEIIDEMCRRYPKVSMEMVLGDRRVDLVAEGVDAAIRAGTLEDSTLVAKNVGVARWALFTSPVYLQCVASIDSPQALRQHKCLQFTPLGQETWTLVGKRSSVTVPLSGQVLVNHVGVIHSMVLDGSGIALLPFHLCKEDCASGRLIHILPEWSAKSAPLHIVYPRQRFMPPKLRGFIDLSAQVLKRWLVES